MAVSHEGSPCTECHLFLVQRGMLHTCVLPVDSGGHIGGSGRSETEPTESCFLEGLRALGMGVALWPALAVPTGAPHGPGCTCVCVCVLTPPPPSMMVWDPGTWAAVSCPDSTGPGWLPHWNLVPEPHLFNTYASCDSVQPPIPRLATRKGGTPWGRVAGRCPRLIKIIVAKTLSVKHGKWLFFCCLHPAAEEIEARGVQ
jgi:hypothetical protein